MSEIVVKSNIVVLLIISFLWFAVFPCTAIEPAWTYADSNGKIEEIAVAPDGSAVTAGAGKVILFSQNGTVLAKEQFGEIIAQSRDGSSIVSSYSSTLSSTVYMFKKKKGADGNPTLQKMWESAQPNKVISFAISDKGDRIVFATGGSGVSVYDGNTGAWQGYDKNYSSLVAMSGKGTAIAGISMDQGLMMFSSKGKFMKKYDVTMPGKPSSLLMDTNGSIVVFNPGLNIISFNVINGSEIWRKKTASEVNMLAMTPGGDTIVAGTTNGSIDLYDKGGNLSWTYYSNSGTGSGQAIKAVALARDASKIIAGSADGKVILLDAAGTLQWIYNTKNDPIQRVAVAADGSLAAAASDNTIYTFSTGGKSPSKSTGSSGKKPSSTVTPGSSLAGSDKPGNTSVSTLSTQQTAIPGTPTPILTEYSVVRTATQSPLNEITGICAFLITAFFVMRRDRKTGRE